MVGHSSRTAARKAGADQDRTCEILGGLQASAWNELPQDVIAQVLRKLPLLDSCKCLNLSSSWACAVKSVVELELEVSVQPQHLRCKLESWQQKSRQHTSVTELTVRLTESLSVLACAKLLADLAKQVIIAIRHLLLQSTLG